MIKCNMEYAKGVVLKESFSSVSNMENAFLTVNLVEKILWQVRYVHLYSYKYQMIKYVQAIMPVSTDICMLSR